MRRGCDVWWGAIPDDALRARTGYCQAAAGGMKHSPRDARNVGIPQAESSYSEAGAAPVYPFLSPGAYSPGHPFSLIFWAIKLPPNSILRPVLAPIVSAPPVLF